MKSYNTEILSVGTELLLGHVTNTDARDVSELLSKIGVNVRWHTVVGDNPLRLRECVEIAKSRADVIITTGGLGPTCDDLTKQVLAECFGLPLVENEAEKQGSTSYIRPDRVFTPNNFAQALLPEGCTVFHNLWGTAPGCAFEAEGKIVVMLPGPPKECVPMFRACAIPYLRKLSDEQIVSHSLRIFGMGESTVDQIFRDEMNVMTNPSMAPYAKECDCLLQVTAKAKSEREAEAMIRPVMAHVREKLGDVVYGEDVERWRRPCCSCSSSAHDLCRGGELHRRRCRPALHRAARRERLLPRRRGELYQRRQGRGAGRRSGAHRGKGRGEL